MGGMGAIFEVERQEVPDPEHDLLAASYGWAHFHAFTRLLAEEEGIALNTMSGYGGNRPWAEVKTPLRPIFDLDCFEDGRLSMHECLGMQSRLCEICELWSHGTFAGDADEQMRVDQLNAVRKLLMVVEGCVKTGRALTIR
jgi:hypothetical protein